MSPCPLAREVPSTLHVRYLGASPWHPGYMFVHFSDVSRLYLMCSFFFICAFLDKFGQSFIQSVSYFASCVDCIRLLEFSHCVYLSLTLSAFPSGYNVLVPGFPFFTLYRTFCCSHAHFVTTFAVK